MSSTASVSAVTGRLWPPTTESPPPHHVDLWKQTEAHVAERADLVLVRLAPYSSICNPIQGCFSAFKAKIKADLALPRKGLVVEHPRGTVAAARMEKLERAARRRIGCIDTHLANRLTLHCQHSVAAAERMEDMQYGT